MSEGKSILAPASPKQAAFLAALGDVDDNDPNCKAADIVLFGGAA